MNYSLSQIANICRGSLCGADVAVESIVTDSRSLSCELGRMPLFAAMRGANHDSHDFIAQMYDRGVRAFLVEHDVPLEGLEGCGFVRVEHSIEALQALAAHHRAQFEGIVVAVTGSNGKTILKEWIAEELPAEVKCYRSPKSYNSQLGVALSLLMLEGDEQLAIIEAGISMPGEMERLERMIRPSIVVFTSIGDAHQEHFESIEQKCEQKMTLARNASTIIYHSYYEPLGELIETQFVDRRLIDAARLPEVSAEVAGGAASRRNAQIVEGFCEAMGYPAPSFRRSPSVAMRLEVKEGVNDSILVNDAYNLDINSLALALDYLHTVALGRPTTLIISDIAQSGLSDVELYGRVADMVTRAGVGRLIAIGSRIRAHAALFKCKKEFFTTTDQCIERIDRDAVAGRAILLKGARDFRFEKLAHALERQSHTTVLEVDLDAMIHNLNYFRSKLTFSTRLMAMVKAGSYGSGEFEVAQMLQHQGVNYLAVAFADEGVRLRERGITMPIVVLNADADSFGLMITNRLEPEIYSLHSLDAFVAEAARADELGYPIHIKLDTGMHRLGFVESEIVRLGSRLSQEKRVQVATIFSHLSCSDMPEQDDYTLSQIALFDRMSSALLATLPYTALRHLANSSAIDRLPDAHFDMCRLGLGLYGFGFQHNQKLRPVSTLRTRIVQIKHLAADQTVGYGRAGVLGRKSVIATIPVGYADGLDRHLGAGRWSMLVAGMQAPIVGRVCMDSCMIDITDIAGVAEGDSVLVFSPTQGNDLESMAKVLDTITYEIMTSISGRVKRIYLKE